MLVKGYGKFAAKEKDVNDGTESCGATLKVFPPNDPGSDSDMSYGSDSDSDSDSESLLGEWDEKEGCYLYSGNTKNGRGHAEMDALYQFLKNIGWDKDRLKDYKLLIICPAKACCVRCSAIMGYLGVAAVTGTFKTKHSMGKTSYNLHPDFRKFLCKFLQCTESNLQDDIFGALHPKRSKK